jgi:hypothetical protein
VNQSLGFAAGSDGLVYWDLSDFEGGVGEPIDDAFAIAVRVTGLQRFDYRGPYSDGVFDHNRIAVDLRRSGAPDLWVDVQKADESKSPRDIPGLGTYKAESMNLDYANPPDHLGFEFDELKRGVLANPGIFACIAPNSMRCGDTNDPDFQTGQLSVSVLVTEPILIYGVYSGDIYGVYSGDEHQVLVDNVVVETGIVASTETNNDGATASSSDQRTERPA